VLVVKLFLLLASNAAIWLATYRFSRVWINQLLKTGKLEVKIIVSARAAIALNLFLLIGRITTDTTKNIAIGSGISRSSTYWYKYTDFSSEKVKNKLLAQLPSDSGYWMCTLFKVLHCQLEIRSPQTSNI